MSASFDFDQAPFEALAESLVGASGLAELHEALAEEGRTLVVEGFERQADPRGTPWVPTNPFFRARAGQILRNTGRYQNSYVAKATADGFTVGSNFVGAGVLSRGATITPKNADRLRIPLPGGGAVYAKSVTIPARQVIPDGDPGPIWTPRLTEVIEDWSGGVLQVNR